MTLAQPQTGDEAPSYSSAIRGMLNSKEPFVTVQGAIDAVTALIGQEMMETDSPDQRRLEGKLSPPVEIRGICFESTLSGLALHALECDTADVAGHFFAIEEARCLTIDGAPYIAYGEYAKPSSEKGFAFLAEKPRFYCKRMVAQIVLGKPGSEGVYATRWKVICADLISLEQLCKHEGWSGLP